MQLRHCYMFLVEFLLLTFFTQLVKAGDGSATIKNMTVKLEPSASFLGEFYYERVGYYIENAGDVNSDGYEDFLIGTFHNRKNGYDAGAAYLILGNEKNGWGLKSRLREVDARFLGKYEYDAFGYYVSGNGDVNGDGYDDFLIGAPAGNELGDSNPGYAFLFLGKRGADWGNECVARDKADASFVGKNAYDHAGEAVAIVGDINRDGYDDFIVGAPLNDDGTVQSGKVYLFLGKAAGWMQNIDIDSADASFITNYYKAWAGYIVSAAGDVNGDGYADFLIGSPHHESFGGRIYLIFGKATIDWGANFELDSSDVIFEGEKPGDKAGWSLTCAGDVNNDGFSDILIGAYANDRNGVQSGKVYLILGKADCWSPIVNLGVADASWKGEKIDDQAGWSISGVPDLNYDGCDEILVGAWHNDQIGSNCGKAYLIYGRTSGWENNLSLAEIPDYFVGEYEGDFAGYCVGGNDMNGDGLGDIWISASYNSDSQQHAGKVYLFLSNRDHYVIDGKVRYYSNLNSVPNVRIKISGGFSDSVITDQAGNFRQILPYHQDYTFVPFKPKNTDFDAETILAYDAALTLQGAVGLKKLDRLQQEAADADQDSAITAFDAALIARYIVGFEDSCSHVGEWIFSPPEKSYFNLDKNYHQQDYSAIIVGNVHGEWQYPDPVKGKNCLKKGDLIKTIVENNHVKIPIKIEPGMNFLSLEIRLEYPSERFAFKEIRRSNLISDFQLITHQQRDKLNLILFGAQSINGNGDVITLSFCIKDSFTGDAEFRVDRFQINDYPAIQGTILLTADRISSTPETFKLYQNYPNPFNHQTAIRLSVNRYSNVKLAIYNLNGEIARIIIDKPLVPDNYTLHWDGTDEENHLVSSGIYLCQVICGSEQQSFKILFIK